MIAVDTNILVYGHWKDSPWHESANHQLTGLAEGTTPLAIPWPCLHEFLAIVAHPRSFKPPTPVQVACDLVDAWLESPRAIVDPEIQTTSLVRLRDSLNGGKTWGRSGFDTVRSLGQGRA